MISTDINCDMGESIGASIIGNDAEIMPYLSSANIACGFHGGDPSVMHHTVKLALKHGVAIGAHPSFPDLEGFGRREKNMSAIEIYDLIIYQVSALSGIVKLCGGMLHHVKPHGALYNMAARNPVYAMAIAEAVADIDDSLILYGLSGSEMIRAGMACKLLTYSEVFADRSYQDDGSLTPRANPDALITNTSSAVEQVLRMVREKNVLSVLGKTVNIKADTVCIHGDGANAVSFAKAIHEALKAEGILIKADRDL
jgi:5-oxoprolinase (ATP-hydrolysing) subunit A